MSLYDEFKTKLLQEKQAYQQYLLATYGQALKLRDALANRLGCQNDRVFALSNDGNDLTSSDLAPDSNNCSHFKLAVVIAADDTVLGEYTIALTSVPALGGGVIVCVNGKQVGAKVDSIADSQVVDSIVSFLQKTI